MTQEVTHAEIMEKIGQLETRCDEGCGSKFAKKFPQGVILAIFIQTFGIIWWAAGITNDVSALVKAENISEIEVRNFIAKQQQKDLEMYNSRHLKMSERVTRVESNYQNITNSLKRIERKLMLIGTEKVK